MGGPAPAAPNATTSQYVLPKQASTANNYLNSLNTFEANNPYYANTGNAKNILTGTLNNPTYTNMMSGVSTAGNMGTGAGADSYNAMNSLYGVAPAAVGAAAQDYSAASPYFNTSNLMLNEVGALPGADTALYNTMNNENNNQVNASLAARGLNASGVGAGVSAQEQQLFNENWQNYLVGLQNTGIGAASTAADTGSGLNAAGNNALTSYGTLLQGGSGLGNNAFNQTMQGATAPYNAYLANLSTQQQALDNYAGFVNAGNNQTQMAMNDALNYLGLGQTSNNNMTNAQLGTYNAQLNQYNANLSNTLGTFGMITSGLGTGMGLAQNIAGMASLGSGAGASGSGLPSYTSMAPTSGGTPLY